MGIPNELRRERTVASFVPYTSLVTSEIVKMRDLGTYVFSLEMRGVAHECADAIDINLWHAEVNRLTRQIADPTVALHSNVVHDEVFEFPEGEFANNFARHYNERYRAYLAGRKMYATRLFLSVVYRPKGKDEKPSRLAKVSPQVLAEQESEDITTVQDLMHTVLAGLDTFGPRLLECYEHDGVLCSQTLELFDRILNGTWQRVAVPRAEIRDMLPRVRPFFGKGGLMSRKGATSIEYGVMLAIKEYPTPTVPGMLDALCGEPYPWVLSQSFTYVADVDAMDWMGKHLKRMANSGDQAVSQMKAIRRAMNDLASGKIAMGHHELSLQISAPDEDVLTTYVASAGGVLSSVNIKWVREDLALASAFFSMLPGNLMYRISPAMIDNTNFSSLISPHYHPQGRFSGAQWGPAVTVFKSSVGSPIAFNWHQPDPDPSAKFDPNHKEPATTWIIGPTGNGKNVLAGHLLTQTQKYATFPEKHLGVKKLSCVTFGRDQSMSVLVAALGGMEYQVKAGVPSGLAPFQLDPTPENLAFLDEFVTYLASPPDTPPLSLHDRESISEAVLGVMSTDKPLRRLGALLQFFTAGETNGLYARLAPWCAGGRDGWLFDNDVDTVVVDYPVLGFDNSDFLNRPRLCTALMMYELHRVDSLLDGRRVPIIVDEAPSYMSHPYFSERLGQGVVRVRKLDGFYVLTAQNARQVLNSPLASLLTSQPPTMIFLRDPSADERDLVRGFKLTKAEVELIKGLEKRQALLRQGNTSTVIDLTLKGFEDEIAVLSGNKATATLCNRLIEELGRDPANWLGEFQRLRKGI